MLDVEIVMLQVQLFALARQLAGRSPVSLPWSDGQTVRHLKQTLAEMYPNLQPLVSRLLVAINNEYADDNALIRSSDEIACFPPVSGG